MTEATRDTGRGTEPSSTGRRRVVAAALSVAAAGAYRRAHGQEPARTSLIVPFSAGSMLDLFARTLAEWLAEPGMPKVVVENLPGASGIVASNQFLRQSPEQPALLLGTSGLVCNVPLLARTPLGFDPQVDFVPVCALARTPFVLFSGTDYPASNLRELQSTGRAAGAPLLYAGADTGSANHVAGEVVFEMLGIRGTHVPYRHNQQAYIDVVEKRIDLGIFSWQNIAALVKSGKAKVLAVLSNAPLRVAPSLPTPAAQGFGRFDIQGWFGVFAARNLPPSLLAGYEKRLESAAKRREVLDFLADSGQEPFYLKSADFRSFIGDETARYRTVLKRLSLI